jgi:hypothetical protein
MTAALPAGFCTPVPIPTTNATTRNAQNGPTRPAATDAAPVIKPEAMRAVRSPARSAMRPPTIADHVPLR